MFLCVVSSLNMCHKLIVGHELRHVKFFGWYTAAFASHVDILLAILIIEVLIDQCPTASIAIYLVGCSVARVQAVNTLTLLLVWAVLEQSVIQIRNSWSNIMRVSLGIGAWLSVNTGELVTRSAKFASIALSSFAVDCGFVAR